MGREGTKCLCSSHPSPEAGIRSPLVQMGKPRLRDVERLSQCLTARTWRSQGSGPPASRAWVLVRSPLAASLGHPSKYLALKLPPALSTATPCTTSHRAQPEGDTRGMGQCGQQLRARKCGCRVRWLLSAGGADKGGRLPRGEQDFRAWDGNWA